MTQNDSHVVVHHYIDSLSHVNFLTMACFIVLAIIVLILLIILVFVIFLMLRRYKLEPLSVPQPHSCETLRGGESAQTASRDNIFRTSAINQTAIAVDNNTDINSNFQNIPMSLLKSRMDNRHENSSESSAGLCEVLFPPQHEGEIIYESPPKLLTFAGRVFTSTRRKSRASKTDSPTARSEPKPSSSAGKAVSSATHNTSLEWDYFEPRQFDGSNASNVSETVEKNTVDVCWV